MIDEHHEHEHGDEHEHDECVDDTLALELDTQSQIFLEMRQQNIEVLKVAAQVMGLSGSHGLLKPNDLHQAKRALWDLYAEFYSWVDPEVGEDDDDDDEEDEDEE
jgi:hypothetical protein